VDAARAPTAEKAGALRGPLKACTALSQVKVSDRHGDTDGLQAAAAGRRGRLCDQLQTVTREALERV
jgi:hypothetical protein